MSIKSRHSYFTEFKKWLGGSCFAGPALLLLIKFNELGLKSQVLNPAMVFYVDFQSGWAFILLARLNVFVHKKITSSVPNLAFLWPSFNFTCKKIVLNEY